MRTRSLILSVVLCVGFILALANAADAENLLTANPTFDNNTFGWYISTKCVYVPDEGYPAPGCIETNPNPGDGDGYADSSGDPIAVSAGNTYTISWSARSMGGSNRQWVGAGGGGAEVLHDAYDVTASWQTFSMEITCTEAGSLIVWVYGPGVNPLNSMCQYDNFSVELLPFEVNFNDSLDAGGPVYTDNYTVGAGDDDGYDPAEDVQKTFDPAPYVAMFSTVSGGIDLSRDARPYTAVIVNWDIDKKIGGTLTGTETITWTLTNIPFEMIIRLIDYGTDATRTNPLAIVDLKNGPASYEFDVTGASGIYRYMRFQTVTFTDTDSDGDGMEDSWEFLYWGDLSHTAEDDDDIGGGDGWSNYKEYIADTDPTDSGSYFAIEHITVDDTGNVTLSWSDSKQTRLYSIYYNDSGLDEDWKVVLNRRHFNGTDGNDSWTDNGTVISSPPVTSAGKRFYKVKVDVVRGAENKKILAWAVNAMEAAYLKDHISGIEAMYPEFNGIVFPAYPDDWTGQRSGQEDYWFGSIGFESDDFDGTIVDLQSTNFVRFTDNFLYLTTAVRTTGENISWFSDAGWAKIISNTSLMARICKEGGLKGIMLDIEMYAPYLGEFSPPFEYDPYIPYGVTLEQVKAKVRQRGNEFMDAIAEIYPDITFIMMPNTYATAGGGYYELLPSFIDGILENLGQGTIIDGGERGYLRKEYQEFVDAKEHIRGESLSKTTLPELYLAKVTQAFGFWGPDGGAPWYTEDPADFDLNFRSPDDLEHSLYYALSVSDNYVWIYCWHPQVYWNPDLLWQYPDQCSLCPHSHMPQENLDAFSNSKEYHDRNWEF